MRLAVLFALVLAACGGEEKKEPASAPAAPPPAAPPPAARAAPVAPPPEAAPPVASGPYTPDDLAKAAYEKAKAAGSDAAKNPRAGDPTAIAAGKATYDAKCVTCHGATGHGDGIAGQALPQKPANFHWKERWDATSPGVKHWILLNGVQGSAMAPLGLTDAQAWEVLAYLESEFVGKP